MSRIKNLLNKRDNIEEEVLSQSTFRIIAICIIIGLIISSVLLYRSEIDALQGSYSINGTNFSIFADARDLPEVYDGHVIATRQGHRVGALIVGPSTMYSRELIPVSDLSSYVMEFKISTVMNGLDNKGSLLFSGIIPYDKHKNPILAPQTHLFGLAYSVPIKSEEGIRVFQGIFSPEQKTGENIIPPNTAYIRLYLDLNYGDPSAAVILSNIKFNRVQKDHFWSNRWNF